MEERKRKKEEKTERERKKEGRKLKNQDDNYVTFESCTTMAEEAKPSVYYTYQYKPQ